MDGKTFHGWKMASEHTNAFTVVDGAFRAAGERCHLYYVGDGKPFKNFELKVEVMTQPNANGGIYFHTQYQDTGCTARLCRFRSRTSPPAARSIIAT